MKAVLTPESNGSKYVYLEASENLHVNKYKRDTEHLIIEKQGQGQQ